MSKAMIHQMPVEDTAIFWQESGKNQMLWVNI